MSQSSEKNNPLFASLKKNRSVIQSAIDDWIESYRQDRDVGILELLQFFVLSSGCSSKISCEMRETLDFTKIVRKLVEEFDDQAGGDYPIITAGVQWKKFRSNFCEFIHILIRQCQHSIIYDQYFMENMISFLITLSDSQVRAFRHTATLAAVTLMTSLVDVALTLSINIDNNQRQYDKARSEKSRGDKLNVLSAKRTELDENMKDIKTILGYLFKSIFVHRYKDVVPEIRSLCMNEIGIWMKKFPNYFLDDPHLKYVGWTIYDKESEVRLRCLQALLPLYETEEILQRMELFTNKYKDRFISMTMDKDSEVAVHAIKLMLKILKHYGDILSNVDCEKIYMLIFTTHRNVAQAAGEFLITKLFKIDGEMDDNLCSRRGKKLSPYTSQLKDLISFFIECDTHEHCAYLVDSLIDSHPMIKDWECMTDLLLEESNSPEDNLGEKQESVLIDLMSCAVKQISTGEPPIDRNIRRSKISAKDLANLNEEKEKISLHFSSVIPDLLRKYKTDTQKVIDLLEIPLHFLKNTYSQNSDDMENLLTVISELIEIHSETEVIESCARIYEFMQDENFTHYRLVRVEVSTLLDKLLQKYKESLTGLCEGSDDKLETISFVTKKIAPIVSCCHQMDTIEIWNIFFENWIKDFQPSDESNKFADEATKNAFTICFYILIWRVHFATNNDNHDLDLKLEKFKLVEFINEAFTLLDQCNQQLAEEIYFILCDVFIIFSPHLAHDSPQLSDLICQPNKSQTERLIAFIESNVFIQDDQSTDEPEVQDSVEKLYNKRHLLAAFCKLIIYNVVPMRYSNCILRHYVDFFNDFGDIIKTTLGKLREMNKVICAKTMASTLIQMFKEIQSESDENPSAFTKQNEDFLALKELAKRFALSFGLDNQKNRDAIASLHRDGIHFSFEEMDNPIDPLGPPPNLPFLEILVEFSNKIFKQDKKTVLTYLEKCVKNAGVDFDEWQPLVLYRNSLSQVNEFDISLNRSKRVTRKRALNADDDESMYETPVKRVRKRYVSFSVSNIEDSTTSMD